MAEEKKESGEVQNEGQTALEAAGLDDLTHDPMGTEDEPEPETAEEEPTAPAAEPAEEEEVVDLPTSDDGEAEPVVAEGAQVAETEGDAAADADGRTLYTLPDGTKCAREDIDDETFAKMIVGWNQQQHSQRLSEERTAEIQARDQHIAELNAQNQQYVTNWEILRQQVTLNQQRQNQQQAQQPPPTREQMSAHFAPEIQEMVKSGYVSELEADEHSGLIAGFLYRDGQRDQREAQKDAMIGNLMTRVNQIEGTYGNDLQGRASAHADATMASVRNELTSSDDEVLHLLKDDNNWNSLMGYLEEHIAVSNGGYNPQFNAEVLAGIFYGMPAIRELTRAQRGRAAEIENGRKQVDAKLAGGQGGTGSGKRGPAAKPQTRKPTALEEAGLDDLDGGRQDLAGNRMEPDASRLSTG